MEYTEKTVPMHWPRSFVGDGMQVCPGDANELWGQWINGLNTVYDNEGNEVRAVYGWEEGDPWACNLCDPIIARMRK